MRENLIIREATPDDVSEILRQRRAMYLDMDYDDSPELAEMLATCEPFLRRSLADRSFRSWLGLLGRKIAGGGAVIISPWLSHPYDLECRRATILNVYVYPEFRRRGVARKLMQTIIAWCREQNLASVFLHASKDGRPLYDSLGFESTNEMKLKLR
ncbi:MAG TPA: GNAT family N-acetyltransferase [Terriglobales bacterium]|jgi:GNAT superfamily N-acetyltransferase|nr:GNAT family N-acetyltransferase [Terriglobales bacterium]